MAKIIRGRQILFRFLFLSILPGIGFSKSPELDPTYLIDNPSTPLKENIKYIEYVDRGYDFLTRKVYLLSNTVDAIFTQRSVDESRNKSYFRVWYEFSKREGNQLISQPDFRLRLYLKETRKLLRVTFDNTTRNQDTQSELSQTQASANTRNEDKNLSASIGVNLKETKRFKFSSGAGVRLRGIPPNVFLRGVSSFNDSFGDVDFSFSNNFFYYSLDGFGNTTNINFLYVVDDLTRFIFESFGTWLEPRLYNSGAGFQGFYAWSDKVTLNAQVGLNANKEDSPFAVKNYFISTGYRQLLYKDWFFVEVSPAINWDRENSWTPKTSIYIRLEAFLGGNK